MKRFVIAIDGPAGAGKGTVARLVAERLGFLYVDTGAMYRALTLKALRCGIPLDSPVRLTEMARQTRIEMLPCAEGCRVLLDGTDVSEEIRSEEVSRNSHAVSSVREVREVLWKLQRSYRDRHNLVMEGRDIGSVVFPDAELKVYLDADLAERARRRWLQLKGKGIEADLTEIQRDLSARDRRDAGREIAPLVRLPDAVYVDSTRMRIEDEVALITRLAKERMACGSKRACD